MTNMLHFSFTQRVGLMPPPDFSLTTAISISSSKTQTHLSFSLNYSNIQILRGKQKNENTKTSSFDTDIDVAIKMGLEILQFFTSSTTYPFLFTELGDDERQSLEMTKGSSVRWCRGKRRRCAKMKKKHKGFEFNFLTF